MRFGILSEDGLFTGTGEVPPPIAFTAERQDGGLPMWAQESGGSLRCTVEDTETVKRFFEEFGAAPRDKVSVMFEQRHEARQLPRTVREAKARRKGNRGNPRRRTAFTTTRTVMYDALFSDARSNRLSANQSASEVTVSTCGPNTRIERERPSESPVDA